MSHIELVTTALPPHGYDTSAIATEIPEWLHEDQEGLLRLTRLLGTSRIKKRYFALPLEQLFALKGQAERAQVFHEVGLALASSCVAALLEKQHIHPREIETIIFTSCSVPSIPSMETRLIQALGFDAGIRRIPLYQYGCVGGAAGLALGLLTGLTLVLSVELCSLVFQPSDRTGSGLVGSAIFGDGAGCALLDPRGSGPRIVGAQSYLIPDTGLIMGYTLQENGTHLLLDRELPRVLAEEAPPFIERFLAQYQLHPGDISNWLLHPGGARILEYFEEAFSLRNEQLKHSRQVLTDYGNMSSASLLFVLEHFLAEQDRSGYSLMLGVGPGLMLQLLLIKEG